MGIKAVATDIGGGGGVGTAHALSVVLLGVVVAILWYIKSRELGKDARLC